MTTVSLIAPIQIQGQSITDETTGPSTSNTTSAGGDRVYTLTVPLGIRVLSQKMRPRVRQLQTQQVQVGIEI